MAALHYVALSGTRDQTSGAQSGAQIQRRPDSCLFQTLGPCDWIQLPTSSGPMSHLHLAQWKCSKPDPARYAWPSPSDLLLPEIRPPLVVGIGLAIFQQVTGINTVIYFAPTIIRSAGLSSIQVSILATAGIGAVNVLMTIVSMWLIDRVGRRPLLLTGIAGMTISLGALGLIFHRSAASRELATWLSSL